MNLFTFIDNRVSCCHFVPRTLTFAGLRHSQAESHDSTENAYEWNEVHTVITYRRRDIAVKSTAMRDVHTDCKFFWSFDKINKARAAA